MRSTDSTLSVHNIQIPNQEKLQVTPKNGDENPLEEEARADREQNRKLKENVKKHIVWIIWVLVIFTIIFLQLILVIE